MNKIDNFFHKELKEGAFDFNPEPSKNKNEADDYSLMVRVRDAVPFGRLKESMKLSKYTLWDWIKSFFGRKIRLSQEETELKKRIEVCTQDLLAKGSEIKPPVRGDQASRIREVITEWKAVKTNLDTLKSSLKGTRVYHDLNKLKDLNRIEAEIDQRVQRVRYLEISGKERDEYAAERFRFLKSRVDGVFLDLRLNILGFGSRSTSSCRKELAECVEDLEILAQEFASKNIGKEAKQLALIVRKKDFETALLSPDRQLKEIFGELTKLFGGEQALAVAADIDLAKIVSRPDSLRSFQNFLQDFNAAQSKDEKAFKEQWARLMVVKSLLKGEGVKIEEQEFDLNSSKIKVNAQFAKDLERADLTLNGDPVHNTKWGDKNPPVGELFVQLQKGLGLEESALNYLGRAANQAIVADLWAALTQKVREKRSAQKAMVRDVMVSDLEGLGWSVSGYETDLALTPENEIKLTIRKIMKICDNAKYVGFKREVFIPKGELADIDTLTMAEEAAPGARVVDTFFESGWDKPEDVYALLVK